MATLPEKIDLNEILKTPDDLRKIPSVKAEIARRKAIVDEQIRQKREELHTITQKGMTSLGSAQQITNMIKEEMMNVERLGAEAQALITKFPAIREVATLHRNFRAVETMKHDLETFGERLEHVRDMLVDDEEDLREQPNLLRIHYELSQLQEIRDEALDQAKKAPDASCESTLLEIFKGLDEVIEDFNQHLGMIMSGVIDLVGKSKEGIVVRMAIIVVNEEKRDDQIRERRQVRNEYSDLATKFKSLAVGEREPREYKKKMLQAIRATAEARMVITDEEFMQDPDKLDKKLRWFFNDLNAAKQGLAGLVPKNWKILEVVVKIYHELLYEWLQSKVNDKNIAPTHMLAIIHYKPQHMKKMSRLGVPSSILEPELPGGHDSELVREYQKLVVDKVDEWMMNINTRDLKALRARTVDEIEPNEHQHFRGKSSYDMWTMLQEQLIFAANSDIPEIVEGVTGSMLQALNARREAFSKTISDISNAMLKPDFNRDSAEHLFDWFIAIANDAAAYTLDDEAEGIVCRLTNFKQEYESYVRKEYAASIEPRFENLTEGFTDLILLCITTFVKLIFAMDLRPATSEIFTPAWFSPGQQIPAILEALTSYLDDYLQRTPQLLGDMLVTEMSRQLLVEYLIAIRNRGVKYRRNDPFADRVKQDIEEIFKMFQKHSNSFQEIRESWRAINGMVEMLDCEKQELPAVFEGFLASYWDVKMGWVEAVLRSREDIDWGPISGDGKGILKTLRAIAANKRGGEGAVPTIFSWVD